MEEKISSIKVKQYAKHVLPATAPVLIFKVIGACIFPPLNFNVLIASKHFPAKNNAKSNRIQERELISSTNALDG